MNNTQLLITFERRGYKFVFCKSGIYFALTLREFDAMREAMDSAAAQSQENADHEQ